MTLSQAGSSIGPPPSGAAGHFCQAFCCQVRENLRIIQQPNRGREDQVGGRALGKGFASKSHQTWEIPELNG